MQTFDKKTHVMGIINVTSDSFSGDGVIQNDQEYLDLALKKAHQYMRANVDVLDIGGESTRPGSNPVSEEEEMHRVLPVIQAIRHHYSSVPISIDTVKANVAKAALTAGATIINDVSGFIQDSEMADVAVEFNVPIVLMHNGRTRQESTVSEYNPLYTASYSQDIVQDVMDDLEVLANQAISRGVKPHQIIVDPGIGFGKMPEQNLPLLKNLDRIKAMGYPILLGVSRKFFIGHLTQASVDKRLPGSIAAATIGVMKGANIIRVHDVEESIQAVQIADAIRLS